MYFGWIEGKEERREEEERRRKGGIGKYANGSGS